MAVADGTLPTTLKWSKKVFSSSDGDGGLEAAAALGIRPGGSTNEFKQTIQLLTGVPIARQKLLCKHGWKGTLRSDATFDVNLSLPPKQASFVVTLIGSAEKLPEPPKTRTKFQEDITPEEIEAERNRKQMEDEERAEGMIVALQRPPGASRGADSNRTAEPYQYDRHSYGLPQYRIEAILRDRRTKHDGKLIGNVVMTLGLELRRAYVNDLAVLADGTLVSALDDGHIQMWRHAEMMEDVVHGNADGGGVEHVVAMPQLPSDGGNGPAFATAGQGVVRLWDEDGQGLAALRSPPGTSPSSVAVTTLGQGNDESTLLAAAYKITHRSDPNQFRLVPQDEAGRQRRAAAEDQERQLQQQLAMSASRAHVYIRRGNQVRQMEVGPRNQEGSLLPITALATVPTNDGSATLVLGDAAGRLRITRFRSDEGNAVDLEEYLNLQLRSTDGTVLSIVCIEPLSGSLLAVSTRQLGEGLHQESQPRPINYIGINVPAGQALHIIDLETKTCRGTVNGHKDVVHAICLLPDGCLATCGGKMDAKTRVWDLSKLQDDKSGDGCAEATVWSEAESKELEEVGYVFGLAVLPDTKPGSQHYALAAARYNVVRMCI